MSRVISKSSCSHVRFSRQAANLAACVDRSQGGCGLESYDKISAHDYGTCNFLNQFISDMIIAGLAFDGSTFVDDITEASLFPDYKCSGPSMFFDVSEECMILPFLKDSVKVNNCNGLKPCEENMVHSDKDCSCLEKNEIRSCNREADAINYSDHAEDFDPQFFMKKLPELFDMVSNFRPPAPSKELGREKSITLVLDLDETLVHSTLEYCDDADFTFIVFFNMKAHTVYVRQRPHLHIFLERVAEMFEVVIFTASQVSMQLNCWTYLTLKESTYRGVLIMNLACFLMEITQRI